MMKMMSHKNTTTHNYFTFYEGQVYFLSIYSFNFDNVVGHLIRSTSVGGANAQYRGFLTAVNVKQKNGEEEKRKKKKKKKKKWR